MDKIRPNLYLGNYASAFDERQLRDNDVTAEVNVAYEISDPPIPPVSVRQVKIGLVDGPQNLPAMKELAVRTVMQLLENGEVVLVHCNAGMSRSVWVVCEVLARLEGGYATDRFYEIQHKRPFAIMGPLFHRS